jgi:hypothetical protein
MKISADFIIQSYMDKQVTNAYISTLYSISNYIWKISRKANEWRGVKSNIFG